ncbi:13682_t:CDS:2 [Funneliformis geosporum]|uniref:13682_t:CDS:1 n=1 Tax=Funneliformis geosporum TaxID=1117311 RepID=A0A9W4WPW5_9GLOM|nr:13682_t:CDS:2 [Funneliformis geosporum]
MRRHFSRIVSSDKSCNIDCADIVVTILKFDNDNESINPYITDGDELFDYALNHIAHRADAFNPFSSRYNPSTQNGYGGHTARWSHSRARSNNEIVRNFYNV